MQDPSKNQEAHKTPTLSLTADDELSRSGSTDPDEKRRLLEQKRQTVEQEKRKAAALKKRNADAAEKAWKAEEEARLAQAKAKAEEDRKAKLQELLPSAGDEQKATSRKSTPRRVSLITRDLQGYSITPCPTHSFGGPQEVVVLFNFINRKLSDDPDVIALPLDGQAIPAVFEDLSDGTLACRLLNKWVPGYVKKIETLSSHDHDPIGLKAKNWLSCLQFLNTHGVKFEDKPSLLWTGSPDAILQVIWQLCRICLEIQIKKMTDTLSELHLSKDDPLETILTSWVNLLISNETHPPAQNIATDFQDSFFYLHLCRLLLGTSIELESHPDIHLKAQTVVDFIKGLALGPLITEDSLIKGTFWVNYICLCNLFLLINEQT